MSPALIFLTIIAQGCLGAVINKKAMCSDICPEYYSPLCGSDGQTYSNICFFNSAQCHDATLTLAHKGECSGSAHAHVCPAIACIALYDPVCGTDGKTYGNECELHTTHCNGDVTVAYKGACSSIVF